MSGRHRHTQFWRENVIGPSELSHTLGHVLPCPFCASTHIGLWMRGNPHVTCGDCGADGPYITDGPQTELATAEQALAAWNKRPKPP